MGAAGSSTGAAGAPRGAVHERMQAEGRARDDALLEQVDAVLQQGVSLRMPFEPPDPPEGAPRWEMMQHMQDYLHGYQQQYSEYVRYSDAVISARRAVLERLDDAIRHARYRLDAEYADRLAALRAIVHDTLLELTRQQRQSTERYHRRTSRQEASYGAWARRGLEEQNAFNEATRAGTARRAAHMWAARTGTFFDPGVRWPSSSSRRRRRARPLVPAPPPDSTEYLAEATDIPGETAQEVRAYINTVRTHMQGLLQRAQAGDAEAARRAQVAREQIERATELMSLLSDDDGDAGPVPPRQRRRYGEGSSSGAYGPDGSL